MRFLVVIAGGLLVASACTNDFDGLGTEDGIGVTMAGSGGAISSAGGATVGGGNTSSRDGSGPASGSGGESTTSTGGTGGGGGTGASGASGAGGTPPAPVSCDEQYDTINGYVPCPAEPGQCGFNLTASGQTSCAQQCELHGGECLDAIDNGDACTVHGTGEADCGDGGWSTVWCICSHGCGGGPPCGSGMTCEDGACSR